MGSPDTIFAVDVTAAEVTCAACCATPPLADEKTAWWWVVAALQALFVSARTVQALKGRGVGRSARLGGVADSAAPLMGCEDEDVVAIIFTGAYIGRKGPLEGAAAAPARWLGASPIDLQSERERKVTISRGFFGHHDPRNVDLPPGQHLTDGFPVLTAGPTQLISTEEWSFTIAPESGEPTRWSWDEMMALPSEEINVDIHCVTRWTKFGTQWRGVALDTFFEDIETYYDYAMVHSYGGYTTNLPLEDLLGGKSWVVFEYEGDHLHIEHGGPARLLVPHLYFWKSAKWVKGITMQRFDEPGFWESFGYHNYGDPWREERYYGD